jgi:hypothetical protein
MTSPAEAATWAQVQAHRLQAQGLWARRPATTEALVQAAAVGLHDPLRPTAGLALAARVQGLTPAALEAALAERRLLRLWSLRVAPHVLPPSVLPAFTLGALPQGEAEALAFFPGLEALVAPLGCSVLEILDGLRGHCLRELAGRALNKQALVQGLVEALAAELPAASLAAWRGPAPGPVEDSLGHQVVRVLLRLLSLEGLFCDAWGRGAVGGEADFVALEAWWGQPFPWPSPLAAGQALVRHFLTLHGPARPAEFKAWAGVGSAQAKRLWASVAGELVPVAWGKGSAWLLADQVQAFRAAAHAGWPEGIRWLPPYDPLLSCPDRGALMPDLAFHRELWRGAGNPGALLVGGRIVAAWKAKKQGSKLVLRLASPQPLPKAWRAEAEAEAQGLAMWREVRGVELQWPDEP